MNDAGLTTRIRITTCSAMKRMMAMGLLGWTTACVNVSAPDKPIEINLNIKVTQEVVYRLDGDAKALIQSNPGIF
jgi:YnbE-like lipoprotein